MRVVRRDFISDAVLSQHAKKASQKEALFPGGIAEADASAVRDP
jgi:hypothetical protein